MLLDFWYSERCTREVKLISTILTCVIIYYCSSVEKLNTTFTLIALTVGVGIHFLRNLHLKINAKNPYAQGFNILFSVLPIMAILLMILLLPIHNKIWTGIQALGFTALGIFIVSIYTNRSPRHDVKE